MFSFFNLLGLPRFQRPWASFFFLALLLGFHCNSTSVLYNHNIATKMSFNIYCCPTLGK